MSDVKLVLIPAFIVLSVIFVWLPLLQSFKGASGRYSLRREDDVPDLVEEDSGPHFTGEIA